MPERCISQTLVCSLVVRRFGSVEGLVHYPLVLGLCWSWSYTGEQKWLGQCHRCQVLPKVPWPSRTYSIGLVRQV